MAQGAKPGEGGQLPGHKVYPWIAKVRLSTPGVGLISPPPHHDIYSIEDLAQLIFDLKNANPVARVHVKLVAESGVGTVAAGVSKAHADVVLISGHDGGTGASPLTSLKHAGVPWELGLAETQQVLLMNRLRDRIVVQVDGQMKTGRDVVVAALLGAEEFGFATAPLVVMGCVMMRVCHLNTCPVGIATQDPELRKTFGGKPEFVQNFFHFIAAGSARADGGAGVPHARRDDRPRRVPRLRARDGALEGEGPGPVADPARARDAAAWRTGAAAPCASRTPGSTRVLDRKLIAQASACARASRAGRIVVRRFATPIAPPAPCSATRSRGVSAAPGCPTTPFTSASPGSAGQSFGAFLPRGITLALDGEANDFVGKGLSGGRIIVRPPRDAAFAAEENVIIGNVALYGATSGDAFVRGVAGERFAVRNSGAQRRRRRRRRSRLRVHDRRPR